MAMDLGSVSKKIEAMRLVAIYHAPRWSKVFDAWVTLDPNKAVEFGVSKLIKTPRERNYE